MWCWKSCLTFCGAHACKNIVHMWCCLFDMMSLTCKAYPDVVTEWSLNLSFCVMCLCMCCMYACLFGCNIFSPIEGSASASWEGVRKVEVMESISLTHAFSAALLESGTHLGPSLNQMKKMSCFQIEKRGWGKLLIF